jgi:hypothetical protein
LCCGISLLENRWIDVDKVFISCLPACFRLFIGGRQKLAFVSTVIENLEATTMNAPEFVRCDDASLFLCLVTAISV